MNNILNKCLLSGYKFMVKLHLRQPGFTYSACGPFTNISTRTNQTKLVLLIRVSPSHMQDMFAGCSKISISVIVEHVQNIGIITAFCLPGGTCC